MAEINHDHTKFELHYQTGGHGGPYIGWSVAFRKAADLLWGDPNMTWIDIVNRHNGHSTRAVEKPYGDIVAEHCPRNYSHIYKREEV